MIGERARGRRLRFGEVESHRRRPTSAPAEIGGVSQIERSSCQKVRIERDDDVSFPEVVVRHEWRAEVLRFIRDRLDPAEAYRLGEVDLMFGELLPEAPTGLGPAEDEERDAGMRRSSA